MLFNYFLLISFLKESLSINTYVFSLLKVLMRDVLTRIFFFSSQIQTGKCFIKLWIIFTILTHFVSKYYLLILRPKIWHPYARSMSSWWHTNRWTFALASIKLSIKLGLLTNYSFFLKKNDFISTSSLMAQMALSLRKSCSSVLQQMLYMKKVSVQFPAFLSRLEIFLWNLEKLLIDKRRQDGARQTNCLTH